jgi:glycosyltransferase involved in cell wall biosynthesis
MERKNAYVFIGAWLDACAMWRLHVPHLNYPGSSFFVFASRPNFSRIVGQDVCIVQRCCTKDHFEFIQLVRKLGMTIVYDLDDNMWEIPRFNPAHSVLTAYKDGFATCMQYTDVISVSTSKLKRAVEKHVKIGKNPGTGLDIPIIVTENKMEKRMFSEPMQREEVVVGWAGSSSHIGDFEIMEEGLIEAAQEHPWVTFEFRGCPPPPQINNLPNSRFMLWYPVAEFCSRMPTWGWSIGLAPLIDNPFNAAKSSIKMLESAYCGIPCLASHVEPYDRFTSHDSELRWLLCYGKYSWARKLRELINDKARREELGRRAKAVAEEHYTWQGKHEGWERVFEAVKVAQDKVKWEV